MHSDDVTIGGSEEPERQLRRLEPAGHTIDRDALMFRAGQRAAGRRLRLWQSLAGTTMLLAAGSVWLSHPWPEPALTQALSRQTADGAQTLTPSLSHRMGEGARRAGEGTARPTFETRAIGPAQSAPVVLQGRGLVGDYLELRLRVALEGMDALPGPGWAPVSPAPVQTIADWLRLPASTAFPSDPFDSSDAVTKGNPS